MNEVKKKHVILGLCAVAIAVVFFFAGFGTGYGVGKGADPAPTLTTESGGMVIASDDSEGADKGVSLTAAKIERTEYDEYGIMPIAEEAYTVTATVSGTGLTANQKNVTWSAAAFKDPSSSWATGKSVGTYVTTSSNGNQLTVQCLKPFGEQIIIKCTSSFNTAVSKELKVDYKDKIGFMGIYVDDFDLGGESVPVYLSSIHNANVNVEFSHSEAYTIKSDVVTAKVDCKLSDDFALRTSLDSRFMEYSVTVSSDSPTGVFNNFFDVKWKEKLFLDGYPDTFTPSSFQSLSTVLRQFLDEFGDPYYYKIVITFSNSLSPINWDIFVDMESVIEWAYNFNSVSLSFDSPYNNGMIFNQD